MAADITKTVICNMALRSLKQAPITAPTESSERARVCNTFYDPSRRAALRACDWNFAKVSTPLTLLGSIDLSTASPTDLSKQDIAPQWSFLYAEPGNCIRVKKVFNPQIAANSSPYETDPMWQREQPNRSDIGARFELLRSPISNVRAIATNLQLAWAQLITDITDESQFDDLFVRAFAAQLAVDIALPLSADKELSQIAATAYKDLIGEAERKNGGEGLEFAPRLSRYEDVRN